MNMRSIAVAFFKLLAAPALATFLASISLGLSLIDLLSVNLFYFFVVYPLAFLSTLLLLPKLRLNIFDCVLLGYPSAAFLLSFFFLITRSLARPQCIFILASIFFFVVFSKRKLLVERIKSLIYTDSHTFFGVSAIIYFIIASIFCFLYLFPIADSGSQGFYLYYQDSLWSIGNTWSIINKGLPLQDIRLSGFSFPYHLIQNLFYGLASKLSGVDPPAIHLCISPFYDLFFLSCALVSAANRFAGISRRKSLLIPFLCLLSAGSFDYGTSGYLGHIYYNPLSLFFGALSFLLIPLVLFGYSNTGYLPGIYLSILVAFSVASKASLLVTLLPALVAFLAFNCLILNRFPSRSEYSAALFSSLLIILLRLTIFSATSVVPVSVYPLNESCISSLSNLAWLNGAMLNAGCLAAGFLYRLIAFTSTSFSNYFPVALLVLLAIAIIRRYSIVESRFAGLSVYCLSFFVFSGSVSSFFVVPGGQVYFFWYSILLCSLVYAIAILKIDFSYWGLKIILILASCFQVVFFGFFLHLWVGGAWWASAVGMREPWDRRAVITNDEILAMNWLKDNTRTDSVIASDRAGFYHEKSRQFKGRFFGYSAFSGRQFFNEGYDFAGNDHRRSEGFYRHSAVINLIKSSSAEEAEKRWRDVHADIVVVSLKHTSPSSSFLMSADIIYSNDSVLLLSRRS